MAKGAVIDNLRLNIRWGKQAIIEASKSEGPLLGKPFHEMFCCRFLQSINDRKCCHTAADKLAGIEWQPI